MSCIRGLLVISACVFIGCDAPDAAPVSSAVVTDTAGVRAAVDSLGAAVGRAHETRDAELYASLWARDGVMSAPGSPSVHGRDSIVAVFRRQPPLPPGATMTIHPTEMHVINPEWAYVMGVDTLRFAAEGEAPPVTQTFTFLVVVRKTAEGWQTYREVLTAN